MLPLVESRMEGIILSDTYQDKHTLRRTSGVIAGWIGNKLTILIYVCIFKAVHQIGMI